MFDSTVPFTCWLRSSYRSIALLDGEWGKLIGCGKPFGDLIARGEL